MNYKELIAFIKAKIFENNEEAITGQALQDVLLRMVADIGGQTDTNKEAIAQLVVDVLQNTADIATNANAIQTNADAVALNKVNIALNAEAIETNRNNIAKNAKAIADIVARVNIHDTDIAGLKKDVAENAASILENANNIAKNIQDIEGLSIKVDEASGKVDAIVGDVEKNTSDIETLGRKVNGMQTEVDANTAMSESNANRLDALEPKVRENDERSRQNAESILRNAEAIADINGKLATTFKATPTRSIFTLTTSSSNSDIRTALTTDKGEVAIPKVGDVFEVIGQGAYGDVVEDSGIVVNRAETDLTQDLTILVNNLEQGKILSFFISLEYEARVGFDSLKVAKVAKSVVDPADIDEDKLKALYAKADKSATAVERIESTEINEWNISKINNTPYEGLGNAIAALSIHMDSIGAGKFVGTKVTFVKTASMKAETWVFQGGSFVTPGSWADEPAGGYNRALYEASGFVWLDNIGAWTYGNYGINFSTLNLDLAFLYGNYGSARGVGYDIKSNIVITFPCTYDSITLEPYSYVLMRRLRILRLSRKDEIIRIKTSSLYLFYECQLLVAIEGILDVKDLDIVNWFNIYNGCPKLESVKLHHVSKDLGFDKSPNITVEDDGQSTLGYFVDNAANEKPIICKVHKDTFAKIPASLIEKATTKQIQFQQA